MCSHKSHLKSFFCFFLLEVMVIERTLRASRSDEKRNFKEVLSDVTFKCCSVSIYKLQCTAAVGQSGQSASTGGKRVCLSHYCHQRHIETQTLHCLCDALHTHKHCPPSVLLRLLILLKAQVSLQERSTAPSYFVLLFLSRRIAIVYLLCCVIFLNWIILLVLLLFINYCLALACIVFLVANALGKQFGQLDSYCFEILPLLLQQMFSFRFFLEKQH